MLRFTIRLKVNLKLIKSSKISSIKIIQLENLNVTPIAEIIDYVKKEKAIKPKSIDLIFFMIMMYDLNLLLRKINVFKTRKKPLIGLRKDPIH